MKLTTANCTLQDAEHMAAMWLHRGNLASESGDNEKAERHYDRAQKWHDRMNELLEVVNEEEGAKSR